MKKTAILIMSLLAMFLLGACGNESAGAAPEETGTAAAAESAPAHKDALVLYFSPTGHTASIASELATVADADILEIQPAQPYTADDLNYNVDDCRANQEMNNPAARPAIANNLSVVGEYNTVYIGYPIWWGTAPRIINTLLDTYDFSGKQVYVFCTSGGSDVRRSVEDLNSAYPNVTVIEGRRFLNGTSADDLKSWVDGLK